MCARAHTQRHSSLSCPFFTERPQDYCPFLFPILARAVRFEGWETRPSSAQLSFVAHAALARSRLAVVGSRRRSAIHPHTYPVKRANATITNAKSMLHLVNTSLPHCLTATASQPYCLTASVAATMRMQHQWHGHPQPCCHSQGVGWADEMQHGGLRWTGLPPAASTRTRGASR